MSNKKEQLQPDDSELVRKAALKDRDAYRMLVEKYQSRAFSLAYSILRNPQDAEDVVQESFVKAYLSLSKFKGDSTFYTWFYRIVRNMAIDVKRKIKRESIHHIGEGTHEKAASLENLAKIQVSSVTPDSEYMRKEQSRRISEVLHEISEEHRTVIMLREVEGMNYDQIAQVTGVSKGTIMSRLHYARKKLQQSLKDLVNDASVGENAALITGKSEMISDVKSNKILRGSV